MRTYLDLFGLDVEHLQCLKQSTLDQIVNILDSGNSNYLKKSELVNYILEYCRKHKAENNDNRVLIVFDSDGYVEAVECEKFKEKEKVDEKVIVQDSDENVVAQGSNEEGFASSKDSNNCESATCVEEKRNLDYSEQKVAEPIEGFNNIDKPNVRNNVSDCKNVVKARQMLNEGLARMYKGILEINPKGYGFLRGNFYGNDVDKDAFVDNMIIRYLGLREGDYLEAVGKRDDDGKSGSLLYILSVNGVPVDEVTRRKMFEHLVPIHPDERLRLENPYGRSDIAIRCIDLIAPIGKGQRAIIVSPPKAGKTTLLKSIANSIIANNPEVKVFVLLIDERPEEVTDMQRSINAEVVYSTFDERPEHHIATAESVLKCAKRFVESGKDVCIVLDSITRLARAYNLTVEYSGRALSGGLDPSALSAPKRFFGSARNVEGGGSLTIIATALIDTGSRLDDVIFEEFKGTGNMEVVLDRRLSERRIFPAIDLAKSSTRREDLLLSEEEQEASNHIRNMLDNNNAEIVDNLINEIYKSKNNDEFVKKFNEKMKLMSKRGYIIRNK